MHVLVCGLVISLYSKRETINVYCAIVGCSFSHVLLLLVKVSLVMFLHYGLYVDVPLPLSQLVSLGNNTLPVEVVLGKSRTSMMF